MEIRTVSDLNNYLHEFYRPSVDAARRGEEYRPPVRTADAVIPAAIERPVYIGTFRHNGTHTIRISQGESQRG